MHNHSFPVKMCYSSHIHYKCNEENHLNAPTTECCIPDWATKAVPVKASIQSSSLHQQCGRKMTHSLQRYCIHGHTHIWTIMTTNSLHKTRKTSKMAALLLISLFCGLYEQYKNNVLKINVWMNFFLQISVWCKQHVSNTLGQGQQRARKVTASKNSCSDHSTHNRVHW